MLIYKDLRRGGVGKAGGERPGDGDECSSHLKRTVTQSFSITYQAGSVITFDPLNE